MQLESVSIIGSTFFGVPRKLSLLGGHPGSFYRNILREIPEPVVEDLEWEAMVQASIDWQPSRTQLLLYGDRAEESASRDSEDILGIKLSLLKRISKHAELRCLQMILALLEATSDVVSHTIEKCLHQGESSPYSLWCGVVYGMVQHDIL